MSLSDEHARGLISSIPQALRYDGQSDNPDEAAGLILRMIPPAARVLDVGCGTGSIARLIIEKLAVEVCGLEPHPERARVASERGVHILGEFLDAPTVPRLGTFDVVLIADVLEHMMDPYEALVLARTLLRPGGSVIISVPNVAHWTLRAKLLLGNFDYQSSGLLDATHLRWFTQKTIRELFERAGYRVMEQHGSCGHWIPSYHRFPWNLIPLRLRVPLLRQLVLGFPRLFCCQHIVRAQSVGDPA